MSTTITKKIETYDVQQSDSVKLSTLFKLFQKAAVDDLETFGITYDALRENNIIFVLTNITLKFFKEIKSGDEIIIRTYPRCCRGVSFIRDFDVYIGSERVAYAGSSWVLIDFISRKIMRPSTISSLGTIISDMTDIYHLDCSRVKLDTSHLSRTDVRVVCYSDLDHNGHMNNTVYSDIINDYLDSSTREKLLNCGQLKLSYLDELLLGQHFDIYTGEENGRFCLSAKNSEDGKDIFTAVIDF